MRTPRSLAIFTILVLLAPAPLDAFAADEKPKASSATPAAAGSEKTSTTAPAASPDKETFTASQLEQMVAPIALYPDSLLMQILMASTYPLEVVEAARWLEANPNLKDEKAVDEALKKEDWDPSVKSICKFPDVLKKMNKNLDWTRDIGDAFLGQQAEVLDATQRMRGKAHEAGNLKSGKEQTVTVQEDKTIVIQQANPEVIYVPSYNPTVVYGAYWPPPVYYPSMYYYPPGAALFTFGVGMMWGAAMWGGCSWGWGHSSVHVNVNNYNNFNRNTNINTGDINTGNRGNAGNAGNRPSAGNTSSWNHNPEHRKGVNYKDKGTAQKFGGSGTNSRVSQSDARGFNKGGGGASTRPSTGGGTQKPGGGGAGTRPSTGGGTQKPGGGASARPSTGSSRGSSYGGNSAFSGSRSSSFDRAASSRGSMSRGGGGGGRTGGGGGGRRR